MVMIIKLVNVHYYDERRHPVKVCFKTRVEGIEELDKRYYISIDDGEEKEVTKEEGNAEYKRLREEHPDAKALVLIDTKYDAVTHISVAEHFAIYVGYDFVCSCDNMDEVREMEEKIKEKLR